MKKITKALIIVFAVVAVAIVAALFMRPNRIISKGEAKSRYSYPESKFMYWRGAEIHYTDTGTGPTVLMVHGFGGSFTNFEPLARQLQKNHRVICVDLPGFGLSDLPDNVTVGGFVPMYRSYTSFLIDHLHLDSVYIIGNSLGGWLSWETAYTRPDKIKKLVLLNSAGYDLEKVGKNLGITSALKWPVIPFIIDRGMPMFISESNAHKIRAKGEPIDMHEVAISNALINRKGNLQNFLKLAVSGEQSDTARIAKIACPTLVIWGTEDRIIPVEHAQRFKRDLPNSRVIIYDTCGHVPMLEYPERVAKDVEAFFAE